MHISRFDHPPPSQVAANRRRMPGIIRRRHYFTEAGSHFAAKCSHARLLDMQFCVPLLDMHPGRLLDLQGIVFATFRTVFVLAHNAWFGPCVPDTT